MRSSSNLDDRDKHLGCLGRGNHCLPDSFTMLLRGLAPLNWFSINVIEVGVHHADSPVFLLCLPGRGRQLQLKTTRLKTRPKMRYRKLKIKKNANYAKWRDWPDRRDWPDKYSHQIDYERVGVRTFKHAKLPISSFDQWVSEFDTIISARDASASENRFSGRPLGFY